jgi:hypothetical protein
MTSYIKKKRHMTMSKILYTFTGGPLDFEVLGFSLPTFNNIVKVSFIGGENLKRSSSTNRRQIIT